MIDLNEKTVAQWLRFRGNALIEAANILEASESKPKTDDAMQPALPTMGTITVESVKKIVGEKSQRVKTLAEHFRVPESEVEKIVNNPGNGFEIKGRGWIVLKQN